MCFDDPEPARGDSEIPVEAIFPHGQLSISVIPANVYVTDVVLSQARGKLPWQACTIVMTYWSWLDLYSITSGKRGVSYSLCPRAITFRHVQTRLMLRTHTHARAHTHTHTHVRSLATPFCAHAHAEAAMQTRWLALCEGIRSPYDGPPPPFVFLRILTIVRIAKSGENDSEWPKERDFSGNFGKRTLPFPKKKTATLKIGGSKERLCENAAYYAALEPSAQDKRPSGQDDIEHEKRVDEWYDSKRAM